MERKRTRGRQKISMAKIEKENDRFATFSKRRVGLFKKASELATLCNADVGVFMFSPTGKPFSFFHPSMESVMTRFHPDPHPHPHPQQLSDDASRLLEACTRTRVLQLNQMIDGLDERLDAEMAREKAQLDYYMKTERGCSSSTSQRWWLESDHHLDREDVQRLSALLENLQSQIRTRREKGLKKSAAF